MTPSEDLAHVIFGALSDPNRTEDDLDIIKSILRRSAVQWTTDKPTTPGCWWHRAAGEIDFPEVVELTAINEGRDFWVHYSGIADGDYLLDTCTTDEWAGPLVPPEE
jgi:hypothetical protein